MADNKPCTICDDKGWVCENHPLKPAVMFSDREDACQCGGAAEPCSNCNTNYAARPANAA